MRIRIEHYGTANEVNIPEDSQLGMVLQQVKGMLISIGFSAESVHNAIKDIDYTLN